MKGFGTVVTGTLVSGRDRGRRRAGGRAGRPPREGARRAGARRRSGRRRWPGSATAINLAGVEVDEIARGQALVTPGAFEETRVADAIVEVLPGAKPLKHGARVRFHQGTAEVLGRVALIRPGSSAAAGRSPEPLALQPGGRAFVRLRLEAPAVLARGDRYILRAYSPPVTIAGGLILDPRPPRTAIRTAAALARCRAARLRSGSSERAEAEERARGGDGRRRRRGWAVACRDDVARRHRSAARRRHARDALVGAKRAVRAGDVLVSARDLHAAEGRHRRGADRASQEPAAVGRGAARGAARAAVRPRTRGGVRSRARRSRRRQPARHLRQGPRRAGDAPRSS